MKSARARVAEVDPGDPGPEPPPAQGVEAKVALEVEQIPPRDVPEGLQLEAVEAVLASDEPIQIVFVRLCVDVDQLVPAPPVRLVVSLQLRSA
jgi:hypothetical protein